MFSSIDIFCDLNKLDSFLGESLLGLKRIVCET